MEPPNEAISIWSSIEVMIDKSHRAGLSIKRTPCAINIKQSARTNHAPSICIYICSANSRASPVYLKSVREEHKACRIETFKLALAQ
jgi:hypothetical protein